MFVEGEGNGEIEMEMETVPFIGEGEANLADILVDIQTDGEHDEYTESKVCQKCTHMRCHG